MRLYLSTIFSSCFLNPIKNPVLFYYNHYPARDMILPIEYIIANLAGLPVIILRKDPKERICMKYPRLLPYLPSPKQIANPISLSV